MASDLARPDMPLIVERDRCRELANRGNERAEIALGVLEWVLKHTDVAPSDLVSRARAT